VAYALFLVYAVLTIIDVKFISHWRLICSDHPVGVHQG
jgi:hypothetical protein